MEDRGDSNLPPPSAASMYAATLLPKVDYDDVEELVADVPKAEAPAPAAPKQRPRIAKRQRSDPSKLASIGEHMARVRGTYGAEKKRGK